ncbi:hypothetical protein IE81DRAFT_327096 [Ceraceosorus guamensis]|uniref:Uncharacterized protein n=1 Tax=Ceraceosorus guamensis TaxID=1522189 RepID=A0A316VMQ5_9BASI|nr:hypothetical protein IE81DRAFT_327096 [Ceraceosorus guamensis]PWN38846.1 hypothetical protein IE81DRAFT_327096 [Ceraceosorus guamensis]
MLLLSHAFTVMMDLSLAGTYDVLLVPLLVPKAILQEKWLPANLRDGLLPIPVQILADLDLAQEASTASEPLHLIFLQLGYQHNTGPGKMWMGMRMNSFSEAKLEVPFMRHPAASDAGSHVPFLFKQTILSSSRIISTAARYTPGARSLHASFKPDKSPSSFEADAQSIQYTVADWLDAKATRSGELDEAFEKRWDAVKRLAEAAWFAERSGQNIIEFHFNTSAPRIPPRTYVIDLTLNVQRFTHESRLGAQAHTQAVAAASSSSSQELNFKSIKAFRTKLDLTSDSFNVDQIVHRETTRGGEVRDASKSAPAVDLHQDL